MCMMESVTYDGHQYHLHHHDDRSVYILCADSMEQVGHVEVSPCGEYFIAHPYDNPLGMATHHHINSTSLEDVAFSIIAGSY